MGQGNGILTVKAGYSLPWRNNGINFISVNNYANFFHIQKSFVLFFKSLLLRDLTYRVDFLRFEKINTFLNYYQGRFKIKNNRKRFSNYAIRGVFFSQFWINYILDWVVISVIFYKLNVVKTEKFMLNSLFRLRVFYDGILHYNFDF